AAIPALHIGETLFEPDFPRGPIDGASLCLAAAAVEELERQGAARAARALSLGEAIAARSAFSPLRPDPDCSAVAPRLALLAPSAAARDAARARLRDLGASAMYPRSLDCVAPLEPHLAEAGACPAARELAARLLTLPTHRELGGAERERVLG